MSRQCSLTGTRIQTGNNVSNSNHKVRRIFIPNLQTVSLRSDLLNKTFQMKITTRTIKEAEERRVKRVIKPSARSLLKQQTA